MNIQLFAVLLICAQEPSRDESGNYLKISLHNEGYGFGFTVQETEDKSIVVSSVFPEGVAYKVTIP